MPGRSLPSWFTLWIKPDQTLINKLDQEDGTSTETTILVPIPSSYSPCEPTSYIGIVGSKYYDLIQLIQHISLWLPTEGKVYVSSSEKKLYFYDPKELRWGVAVYYSGCIVRLW